MLRRFSMFSIAFLVVGALMMAGLACTPDEAKKAQEDKSPSAESARVAPEKKLPPAKEPKATPKKETPTAGKAKGPSKKETQQKEATAGEASKSDGPPAEIVLLSALWEISTRGGVRFTHEKHIKDHRITCDECHHVYEKGKNVWKEGASVKKCEGCHDEPTSKGEKKLPPDDQKRNLKLAFHKNCRTCHRKIKKEDPRTNAPTTCGKCHEKKKK